MEVVALSIASMGFTFGFMAFAQVNEIKKEVQRLRIQLVLSQPNCWQDRDGEA